MGIRTDSEASNRNTTICIWEAMHVSFSLWNFELSLYLRRELLSSKISTETLKNVHLHLPTAEAARRLIPFAAFGFRYTHFRSNSARWRRRHYDGTKFFALWMERKGRKKREGITIQKAVTACYPPRRRRRRRRASRFAGGFVR